MPRSLFFRVPPAAILVCLIASCSDGGDGGCAPTDPACGPAPAPLTVSSVIPADGSSHVEASTPVVIKFSRAVDPTSVTGSAVSVGSAAGDLAVNGTTVTFTPSAPLTYGADYQVVVQGVRDVAGVAMATAFTSGFSTRTAAVCTGCPATTFTRADVEPDGTVVETPDGFIVKGTVSINTGARQITFDNADVDVRFDESGRLQSISGRVEIPSPHERIEFADPVRADVGIFTGRFLNEERDLGIPLKDDTDYFVFDFETSLRMSVATGETGPDATKPIVVRAPLGGRLLMVVDYRDPMYYVFGAQDLIGSAGTGWSLNSRIPFVPQLSVADLGTFDGSTTRVGTFPVLRIISVNGQLVDNEYTEVHLSEEDPFASQLRAGYQAGFNGDASLDLFLKEFVGIEIPLAGASGGVRADAGTQSGFNGYAFVRGMTSRDDSWWPGFIPARPVTELDAQARVESSGAFQVFLAGEFGWDLPAGRQSMSGSFELTDQAMTLAGVIRDGSVDLNVTGVVTTDATTVLIEPPAALLAGIHNEVNDKVLAQIAEAQQAWENLKHATADYEFELSLRGLRASLPAIVDVAKQSLGTGIANALSGHQGTVYYTSLRNHVNAAAAPYYAQLDQLKAAALAVQDNAATRNAIEAALRGVAARKTFSTTYTYYDPIFGIPLHTVTVTRTILTDAQVSQLLQAADNVKHIAETSNIMISMQQIYNQIPDREIFEQVRDDVQDGLLVMEDIGELGFVFPHDGAETFNAYAVINGVRYEVGSLDALTVAALTTAMMDAMIEALKSN